MSADRRELTVIDVFIAGLDATRLDEAFGSPEDLRKTATGTSISSVGEEDRGRAHRIGRSTAALIERLRTHNFYAAPRAGDTDAPYGRFHGIPIIGMGTRIIGGVYMGHLPREAIYVILDAKHTEVQRLYEKFVSARRGWTYWTWRVLGQRERALNDFKHNLLMDLMRFVQQELPYNEAMVNRIARELRLNHDRFVPLDVYIRRRAGVCRQQMCLVGALLELLKQDGYVDGTPRINRRYIPGLLAHAWVKYTASDSVEWIVDPAQNVCLPLAQLDEARRWFYSGSE